MRSLRGSVVRTGQSFAVGVCVLAVGQAAASAQVAGTVLQYQAIFQQTDVNPPPATSTHQFSAFLSASSSGPLSVYEVEIAEPDGTTYPTSGSGTLFSTSFFTYPTREALMAAWPSGPYRFSVMDGEINGEPANPEYTLNQPSAAGAWPTSVPAFTPYAVGALAGMNPNVARLVTVNNFVVAPPANGQMNGLTINVRNPGGTLGQSVWSGLTLVGAPTNSRTIPAGTLQPNANYYASWYFDQRIVPAPPSGVAYAHISFGNITRFAFTTGPAACPADLGRQGGLPGRDGSLDNNDFIAFISLFFDNNPDADLGVQGGVAGSDSQFDNNDFIAFISFFFQPCP